MQNEAKIAILTIGNVRNKIITEYTEWPSPTYIVWVDTTVELFDPYVLHSPSPMNAIEDHLLRMGCIVATSFQEAPVGVVYGWEEDCV